MSLKISLTKFFFNWWYRKHPPRMVKYWNWQKNAALARVSKDEDGAYSMEIQGEQYNYPGFPRGHVLTTVLSKLKHEIKNQIFNWAWERLENRDNHSYIIDTIKNSILDNILELSEQNYFRMLPPEKMVVSVRELWRAWPEGNDRLLKLKRCFCFILQEDDAYRFRVQWLFEHFKPSKLAEKSYVKAFEEALVLMEQAEVVDDMKQRIKLLRRILLMLLEDETIKGLFINLMSRLDEQKMILTLADRYYFRGKYFKVDHLHYDY